MRGCVDADARMCGRIWLSGRDCLYCSVVINMIQYIMLVLMPHIRRYSPHVNRWVSSYSDVMMYMAGTCINAASQEVLSMALGAE